MAEALGVGPIVRQGEWFFVPLSDPELTAVRFMLGSIRVAWGHSLPGGGEPHWTEHLRMDQGDVDVATGQRRARYFVRGRVRHRDHRTVCFDRWRSVHLNAAVRRRSELARGFYWID